MAKRKQRKPKKAAPQNVSPSRFTFLAGWGIFILGILIYSNSLFNLYAVDDAIVIYDNEFTTKGTAGIPGLLKYDTFRGFFKVEGKQALVSGGRYRPLTPVMYALEVELFSPKKLDENDRPVKDKDGDELFDPEDGGRHNAVKFVGHLINVLLYGLTGVVLFWLFMQFFPPRAKKEGWKNFGPFVAVAAAVLFIVHPVHTEVVANVKGRDEIMALLGSLAALYFSFRAYREKKTVLNIWAAALFSLALFSKENAITFVAVVPLAYWFFTKADFGKTALQTLPFLGMAIVFFIIRGSILDWTLGGTPPRELMNNPFLKLVGNQYVDFTTGEWLATVFYTLGYYLKLLVVPHPLSHDYYPRAVEIMTFANWQVILSVLAHVAMGVYALVRLPKRDPVSFGILFYLGTLFLVSNIPFPIGTNMSERFLYMPSVGFCLVAAVLLHRLGFAKKTPLLIGGAVVLLLFSGLTFMRNFKWHDNETLFLNDVKTQPRSAKLQNAAGGVLVEKSILPENSARKNEMLTEAIGHLKAAVKIHPGYKNPYLLLGNAHNYLKQYEASIQAYQNALKLDPDYAEAKGNLGITYRDAGRYFGEQKGDLKKALEYLKKAYEFRPDEYETTRLLGVAYGVSGQAAKAIEFFTKGTQLEPQNAGAWYDLGSAYYQSGQVETGLGFIQKAKEINPNIEQERGR